MGTQMFTSTYSSDVILVYCCYVRMYVGTYMMIVHYAIMVKTEAL